MTREPFDNRRPIPTIVFMMAFLSGCASSAARPSAAPPVLDAVAQDLLYVLTQTPELHSLRTTIAVVPPSTAFEHAVYGLVAEVGYTLESGTVIDGHDSSEVPPALPLGAFVGTGLPDERDTGVLTFGVALGRTEARREYLGDRARLSPIGPVDVAGTRAVSSGEGGGGVEPYPELFQGLHPHIDRVLVSTEPRAPETALRVPEQSGLALKHSASRGEFASLVRQNLFDTLTSNYAPAFVDYRDLDRVVLVFGDESLRLDGRGEMHVARLVKRLDPATDLVSIVGCSHGPSSLPGGNAALAIGRANRVKEAFLSAGVDHRLLVEEGCWSAEDASAFPARGVILTHKRRADTSST